LRNSVAIKVTRRFRNNWRALRSPQNARAVIRIKPALNRTRKTLVILTLGFGIPWRRMKAEPRCTVRVPLGAQLLWHSIGESKRNEVNRAFLLPVWKTIGRKADILVRIEKLKISRFQGAEDKSDTALWKDAAP
jgi:hypothetical protein